MSPHDQAVRYLRKAAEDEAVLDEVLGSGRVSDEVIGFHCQQAAEKLLKGLLSELGIGFRRTHDLRELMDVLDDGGCAIPATLADLDRLTPFGTLYRYEDLDILPGFERTRSRDLIRELRTWVESRVPRDKQG